MPIVGDVLVDRYRIEGLIGAGGMASVYRATDLRLDRTVAVKVLSPNLAADGTLAERFEREARALAAAAHPSVVAVYDVEPADPETGREPFYVMELADGGSLADRLAEGGRLSPAELVRTIDAIADGLTELHRRGIVHRDVKPANVVYSGDRPKLADFGLARSGNSDLTTLTATGTTVGTLAYLAPELLTGSPATPASDVYALGVAAFQSLTGQLPHAAGSITELVEGRSIPANAVSSIAPELGTGFDRPIAAAVAVDPTERPSPEEFAAELSDAAHAYAATPQPAVPQPAIVDPAAETVTSLPIPTRPGAVERRTRGHARESARAGRAKRSGNRQAIPPGLIVVAAFVLVVAALAGLSSILGRGSGATPSLPLVAIPTASPQTVPSVRPSTTPATPPPSASVDPAAAALSALQAVDAAIDDARGSGGLKGKEANELERLAGDVRRALDAHDFEAARTTAHRLAERVDKLDDELDRQRRARLQAAVHALIDAIPED